jgi:hypothetical protein
LKEGRANYRESTSCAYIEIHEFLTKFSRGSASTKQCFRRVSTCQWAVTDMSGLSLDTLRSLRVRGCHRASLGRVTRSEMGGFGGASAVPWSGIERSDIGRRSNLSRRLIGLVVALDSLQSSSIAPRRACFCTAPTLLTASRCLRWRNAVPHLHDTV